MAKKTVVFNGDEYTRNDGQRYYFKHATRNSERVGTVQLHRAVWEYYNGLIPEGCHVHHIDHNIDNNDISNLECIPAAEHLSLHAKENLSNKEYAKKNRESLKKAQEAAKAWHSSDAGIEWHKQHTYESLAIAWNNKSEHVCEECGKAFTGITRARFCSSTCQQRAAKRRKGHIVMVGTASCEVCGKEFTRVRGSKYCSAECRREAAKVMQRARNAEKPKKSRAKRVQCIDDGRVFNSVTEAANELGVSKSAVTTTCRGKYKSTHGFHLRYFDEDTECSSDIL